MCEKGRQDLENARREVIQKPWSKLEQLLWRTVGHLSEYNVGTPVW